MKAIQHKINTTSRKKVLHAAPKDKVLQDQASIKNGAVTEANSEVIDLAAFNTKAAISATLQHVKNVKQALHMSESSTHSLVRSLVRPSSPLWKGGRTLRHHPL